MNISQLFVLLAALAGVFLFWHKTSSTLLKGILIGLIICATAGFSKQTYIVDSTYFIFGVLALIFSGYAFINKKWFALIIAAFTFLSVCSSFFFYDYLESIKFLMIVPIITMLFIIKEWHKHINELSILGVFSIYALTQFLQAVHVL